MFGTYKDFIAKPIIVVIVLSLILSFPVASFGADNSDPEELGESDDYFEEQIPKADGTETAEDGITDSESGIVGDVVWEGTEEISLMGEEMDLVDEEPVDEEPVDENEIITVERGHLDIWINHKCAFEPPEEIAAAITSWKSTAKSTASVSAEGVITAHKLGTAVVQGFDENDRIRIIITVTVLMGRDYTLFVAHKGERASAPENTLPAFRNAVKAGYGGIEFDVWESKTAPKKSTPCILVVHDKNLKSKTGKKMKAYNLNWKNRSKYKIRKNVNGIKKYGPQTIPTVGEALSCIYKAANAAGCKNFVVEIDLKCDLSDRAVKYIIKKVGRHKVHIIGTSTTTLKKFKKYRKYKSLKLWYCAGSSKKSKRLSSIRTAGKAGFDGISMPLKYMSKDAIKLAKSYGMEIGGYGLVDDVTVEKWVNAGCSRFNMNSKVFQ